MRHREFPDRTFDSISIDELRRFAVARNFFGPTTLQRALDQMGFVQADPIRAPARAQDLILRQRVKEYKAGDLERRYAALDVEEDFFINYGYVSRALYSLMHPRNSGEPRVDRKRARLLLEFVRERGAVHPREVDEYFSHGKVTNYWGGSSNATTHLMDAMHYHGMLRVLRREKGIRIYAPREQERVRLSAAERRARVDALVDAVVAIYAPLTSSGLTYYVRRLRYAAPQWGRDLADGLKRARARLARINLNQDFFYPPDEDPFGHPPAEVVRLLAPFDPLVHDRARFEFLWGWEYRFEAYTPVAMRKLGYYAMPLLWRDHVIGWANVAVKNDALQCDIGYVASQPRERAFKRELEAELDRLRTFLGL
ncbi:MAG TPA: crosslink repair DNA glycosylase YcaQ family protein [Pyrinomonadaceae bacterium]|nr:crosslink repair DNA glycosylase YcaQ family protein [Pyrinomonadaceae bacterium]